LRIWLLAKFSGVFLQKNTQLLVEKKKKAPLQKHTWQNKRRAINQLDEDDIH